MVRSALVNLTDTLLCLAYDGDLDSLLTLSRGRCVYVVVGLSGSGPLLVLRSSFLKKAKRARVAFPSLITHPSSGW